MESDDPVTAYRRFLETFSNKIDTLSPEDCETPFRLSTFYLVPSEVEGECLEWTRRYLSLHDCPCGLQSQLARAVYIHFQATVTLTQFFVDSEEEEEEELNEENEESNHNGHIDEGKPQQLYSSRLLAQVVTSVHSVVKDWSRHAPSLKAPPTGLHVCAHAIKNTRRKMEDRHVIMNDLSTLFELKDNPSQAYFAVFDGHGGLEAADYAAAHLHLHLVRDPRFTLDPAAAMKEAYKLTDACFLEKAARESLRCGTTGVSALIRDSQLTLGWLGDSQALLVRQGTPVQIMSPHKPEREDERARIEELGGCVLYFGTWRVNGNISVSRAIGDAPHKPFLCSDADVTTVALTGEEEYLVLACDGLWDVLTPAQVTQCVYKHSHDSPGGLDDVAIGLVNAARDAGSSDNISVVVVIFKTSLSIPQATRESGVLLGTYPMKDSSDGINDKSSSNNSINFPKPPTLNEKLKSKGKQPDLQEVREGEVLNHSMPPYSQELVRQAMFYIAKKPKVAGADTRLLEMALNRAMSGDKKRKQKESFSVYEKGLNHAKEVCRPSVRSLSRQNQAGLHPARVKGRNGLLAKKKPRKRNRASSLVTSETGWAMSSDSEGERGAGSDTGVYRENTTASLGSMVIHKSINKTPRKLKPLQLKGTALTAAAISEASKWAAETKQRPSMELSGKSLPLSSRNALPHILQQSSERSTDTFHNSHTEPSKLRMSYTDVNLLTVQGSHQAKGRKEMSTLSDNILNSYHNATAAAALKFDTASQWSEAASVIGSSVSHRSRRRSSFFKK